MPVTIDDACDMLRGRVRRIAGRDGKRRLVQVAMEMNVSAPMLLGFMNGTINPTIKLLKAIELWCDTQKNTITEDSHSSAIAQKSR